MTFRYHFDIFHSEYSDKFTLPEGLAVLPEGTPNSKRKATAGYKIQANVSHVCIASSFKKLGCEVCEKPHLSRAIHVPGTNYDVEWESVHALKKEILNLKSYGQ